MEGLTKEQIMELLTIEKDIDKVLKKHEIEVTDDSKFDLAKYILSLKA